MLIADILPLITAFIVVFSFYIFSVKITWVLLENILSLLQSFFLQNNTKYSNTTSIIQQMIITQTLLTKLIAFKIIQNYNLIHKQIKIAKNIIIDNLINQV